MLGPSDYGVVAAATIFSTICAQIVGGGFGVGLIQKKESNAKDFSAMLYFHFGLGIILFLLVFFSAPFIEKFFNFSQLALILRILSIQIPFVAINAIGSAYFAKKLQFKRYSIASSLSSLIAGIAAIVCGFLGLGPFSLVIQYVGTSVLTTIFLLFLIRKRPLLFFSFKQIKFYISFGWKVLVTGLLDTLYNDIKGLTLGKIHSSAELAYNNKGAMFPSIVVTNVNQTLMSVLFPYLSNEKDDVTKLSSVLTECLLSSTFLIFPAMVGMCVVARPLILFLLGSAWASTIPHLLLYCLSFLAAPIYLLLEQGIKSLGKGTTVLLIGIAKTTFGVGLIVLCIFIFKNPIYIAVASVFSALFNVVLLLFVSKKYLRINYKHLFGELFNNLFIALLMGFTVFCLRKMPLRNSIVVFIQVIFGIFIYLFLAKAFKNKQFNFIYKTLKEFIRTK